MEITEIRIKLMDDSEDRLRAFCSITFDDCFVIRDLKIIEGNSGPFVAMPSRKLTMHCPECRYKNHLRARFCNQCGRRLPSDQVAFDSQGRAKLYADVAHPINADCRESIQDQVINEFRAELDRAKLPGYVSRYDDSYELDVPMARSATVEPSDDTVVDRIDEAKSEVSPPHRKDQETVDRNATESGESENTDKGSDFGRGIFD